MWQRSIAGRKKETGPGRGVNPQISNYTRPQDPGGGEAQLILSRDIAGEWPVIHPTSRSVAVRSEDVEVTAMSVDAALGQADCALPTDSDTRSVGGSGGIATGQLVSRGE